MRDGPFLKLNISFELKLVMSTKSSHKMKHDWLIDIIKDNVFREFPEIFGQLGLSCMPFLTYQAIPISQ